MLQIMALAVAGVATTCEEGAVLPDDVVEVSWRHYRDDPPSVWFLEVDVTSGHVRQRASLLHGGEPLRS